MPQIGTRLALGVRRPGAEDYVFCGIDGSPLHPDRLSQLWGRAAIDPPTASFHALRHTHASALNAAGPDALTVSRRMGHGSFGITIDVFAHRFADTDVAAAK